MTRRALLALIDRLIAELPAGETRELARSLYVRVAYPMAEVLNRLPGDNIAEKSRRAGVSRGSYYAWLRDDSRPKKEQAKVLGKLTGIDWRAIAGRPLDPPLTQSKRRDE